MSLQEILDDNRSGSMTLCMKILQYFKREFNKGIDFKEYCDISTCIIEKHGIMAPVANAVNLGLHLLDNNMPCGHGVCVDGLTNAIESIKRSNEAMVNLLNNIIQDIQLPDRGMRIMTISMSSQVLSAIRYLCNWGIDYVIVLESRPMMEGRILAEVLMNSGVKCVYMVDASVNIASDLVDFGLYGADAILNDTFVNKIGTFSCVLANMYSNKRRYVVGNEWKILPHGLEPYYKRALPTIDSHYGGEVWPQLAEKDTNKCQIINRYFEFVPLSMVEVIAPSSKYLPTSAHKELIKMYARLVA